MKEKKGFKIFAYGITIFFAAIIIFPLLYILSNSMKDSAKVYDLPPKLIPDSAQSLSIQVAYDDYKDLSDEELLTLMQQDQIITLMSTVTEMPKESIFEIKYYGTMDGKVIYYSRDHRTEIDLEKDNGAFKGVAVTTKTLLTGDRWKKAIQNFGYEFNRKGLQQEGISKFQTETLNQTVENFITTTYTLHGDFQGSAIKTNNWLLLESFIHYFKLPSYIYSRNRVIAEYSFLPFFFNTAIVLVCAVFAQVIICAMCAYPISRLLPKKVGKIMLLFFLGTTMIPFVSIMIPQFTMFKNLGFYDNYAALLLPHVLPAGFYVYMYKGFFDNLPGELLEAASIDGAGSIYTFARICMPLSKPIISIIGLQTFLANWNDFFWAWMVTEKQNLWTLNVALYNISKVNSVKPNFIMGLSVLTIIPVLLITIFFSNQIKESIASAGIKG